MAIDRCDHWLAEPVESLVHLVIEDFDQFAQLLSVELQRDLEIDPR